MEESKTNSEKLLQEANQQLTSNEPSPSIPNEQRPLATTIPEAMNYPKIILSRPLRWLIFSILATISVISALDGGIIPATSTQFKADCQISDTYFGLFGSIDYAGRLFGSIIFTGIINKTNRKFLLFFTLMFKSLTLLATYYTRDFIVLSIFRGVSGFSQVFFTIYFPVWCDQYGPKKARQMMITINQVGLPLGIVLGFGLASVVGDWVWSFIIEGILLFVLAIISLFFPRLYFSNTLVLIKGSNIEASEMPQEGELVEENENQQDKENQIQTQTQNNKNEQDNEKVSSLFKEVDISKKKKKKASLCQNLTVMLCNVIFLFTGLSNAVVFFCMAVVQFWGPDYMEKVLKIESEFHRFIAFGLVCITAPIIGIIFGGILGSLVGGYTKKKSIILCVGLSILGCAAGCFVSLCNGVISFCAVLWIYFFFSTALIPMETGIIISALPTKLRGDGFSVMNFLLNLTGNLPSSYVYGALNDLLKETKPKAALAITMYYNFFGLIMIIIATIVRLRQPDDIEGNEPEKTQETIEPVKDVEKFGKDVAQVYGGYGNPEVISNIEGQSEGSGNDNQNKE